MRRTPRFLIASLVTVAALLGACGSGDDAASVGTTQTAAAGVRVVSPTEASQLLSADPAPTVIDVRTPAEFAEGHLAGAVLIDVSAPDFETRVSELDRDGSYVIYCRSGNRSASARQLMDDLGFTDVADVDGGIVAWVAAGLPVTS